MDATADAAPIPVVVWSDYICPWCYLGRDRTTLLEQEGADVTWRPFELHPEIPPEGRATRPGGRLAAVFDMIGLECAELGLPFRSPTHTPNSRLSLATAAAVCADYPEAFPALDRALFEAHWVTGDDIGDPDLINELVASAGVPIDELQTGRGKELLDASMSDAADIGITGTPAWLFESGFVLPGVQPRELYTRIVTRLRARTGVTPAGPER
jgi:predicted DsbA family dithiol-disulfide isomerase